VGGETLAEGVGRVAAVLGSIVFGGLYQAAGSLVMSLAAITVVAVIAGAVILYLAPLDKGLYFD